MVGRQRVVVAEEILARVLLAPPAPPIEVTELCPYFFEVDDGS